MMKAEGRKHSYNRTSSTNSHSVIFSDFSKAQYREQALQRKLKHLHADNEELEKLIMRQQDEIKDERTVIMYQMGELAKAVRNKMNVSEELKIERSMFGNQQKAQSSIKQLMQKFEAIEKEEKMVLRVRQNLEKMNKTYEDHKQSLRKILQDSNRSHQMTGQKMRNSISDKKTENQRIHDEYIVKQDEMHGMEEKMIEFEQQEPNLMEIQKKLKQQIEQEKKIIEQRSLKIKEMDRWEQIIIDKKKRTELYGKLNQSSRIVQKVADRNREINMKLTEETMFGKKLEKYSDTVTNKFQ